MKYVDETLEHIWAVQRNTMSIASELEMRGKSHDESKLSPPESTGFAILTPQLKGCTYGSEEYKGFLKELGTVLDHHYENNPHHPEHHEAGVNGMTLIDLVEMFCDWMAAVERHADGDIFKSIEINTKRFNLSQQLVDILINTAKLFKS